MESAESEQQRKELLAGDRTLTDPQPLNMDERFKVLALTPLVLRIPHTLTGLTCTEQRTEQGGKAETPASSSDEQTTTPTSNLVSIPGYIHT